MLTHIPILGNPHGIHVGYNIQNHIVSDLVSTQSASTFVIITDVHLAETHLTRLADRLRAKLPDGKRLLVWILPPGEASKSRSSKASVEDFLLANACTRDTCLIALGGGVVGDLAGFVAATFMRGIPVVQIPTTLLAMVDSSIGGKTAIDTPHGKNLIGAFWQPERIYMDLAMLDTLPKRELVNGMAEVIKTAAIWSKEDFEQLEMNRDMIEPPLKHDRTKFVVILLMRHCSFDVLMQAILPSARTKAKVVSEDEKESNLRGLLNFGHSLGHAFEMLLAPDWLHGECVAVGMVLEAEIACRLGHCHPSVVERLRTCLKQYRLPVEFSAEAKRRLCVSQVLAFMAVDKKNQGAKKRIVLLSQIGATFQRCAMHVPDSVIRQVLELYLSESASDDATQGLAVAKANENTCPPIVFSGASQWLLDYLVPAMAAHPDTYPAVQKMDRNTTQLSPGQWIVVTEPTVNTSLLPSNAVNIVFTHQPGSTPLDPNQVWYEFVLCDNHPDQISAALAFIHGLVHTQHRHVAPAPGPSHFVTPTVSDYSMVSPYLIQQWVADADAVEFRADLLKLTTIQAVGSQLAQLRKHTDLPIIFTVRSKPQSGQFDPSLVALYLDLIVWAHHWGCSYVDVEYTDLCKEHLDKLVQLNKQFPFTKIVASFHDVAQKFPWGSTELANMYTLAKQTFGTKAIIKLVGVAKQALDNAELEAFRHQVDPSCDQEVILINMGDPGRLSRVLNRFLTPATHPCMPTAAAPGQLSITELTNLRKALCVTFKRT